MRVVSLVPSSTETLLALGVDVLACTKYCEQPGLRHVGGTKNPDIAAIIELAPDLVVLDREENRLEDHDALVAAGLSVYVSDVTDVTDVGPMVGELADRCGIVGPLVELPRSASSSVRRTAFVAIWRRPWMTIGSVTYGASVLERLGIDVIALGEGPYPSVELADVAARGPDLVIVPSEPYEFSDQHLDEIASAVPHSSIVRVDGRDLFWWGIRTPIALSRLKTALEPQPTR